MPSDMTIERRADEAVRAIVRLVMRQEGSLFPSEIIASAIRAAVEQEREACAVVCDEVAARWRTFHSVAPAAAADCANAIRARGDA